MSFQRITLDGTITPGDTAIPTLTSADYSAIIGGNAHVTDWYSAQPGKMTLVDPAANGGTVTSVASRKSGSVATLAANPPTTQRPNYSASDSHFKGRGSVLHDSGGSGDQLNYNGTFPLGGNFYKMAIVYFASAPSLAYVGVSSDTAGNRHIFTANSSNFLFRVGASGTEAQASQPFATGWTCLIGCWNEAAKRARLSIDFGVTWAQAINASAVASVTTGLQLGKSSDFYWSDQAWGDLDLSDGSTDSDELLAAFRGYATSFVKP